MFGSEETFGLIIFRIIKIIFQIGPRKFEKNLRVEIILKIEKKN